MGKSLKYVFPLLLLLVFPLLAPNSYFVDLGIKVAIFGIVAMGLGILIGQAGQISLGQAALFGVGSYVSVLANSRLGWSFWWCLPLAGLAAAFVSMMQGFAALRLKGHFLAMITLASGLIFTGIVRGWTSLTGGAGGIAGIAPPEFMGFIFVGEKAYFYLAWGICVAFLIFGENICSYRIGRALSAIRQNDISASTMGVNVFAFKLQVFVVSGFFAGVAGSLFAHYLRFLAPDSSSLTFSVSLLSMIVVGGLRQGAWGGLIGALFMTLLTEVLSILADVSPVFSDYSYQLIFKGLLVLLTVLFVPEGLVGLIKRGSRLIVKLLQGKGRAYASTPD